jgi:signal transduction histidine kinase
MAAHVTHEVRNPLSSIGLNVELLEEELAHTGHETQGLLRAVRREIDRLTAITEEYLRVARLPAPHMEAEELGAIVQSIVAFATPEMKAAGITLDVSVEERLPHVSMDEAQIRQALLNVLRNAREAMPAGGTITVEARHADGGLCVSVRDQGSGVAAEHRAGLFELFFTTKERGTGLGLSLTQQIMLAHGGLIRYVDAPGAGAIFELWFPSRDEPPLPSPRAAAAEAIT